MWWDKKPPFTNGIPCWTPDNLQKSWIRIYLSVNEITHSQIQNKGALLLLHLQEKDGESYRQGHQAMSSGNLSHPRERERHEALLS